MVELWLKKINLGLFASVLNMYKPFTGRDLMGVTLEDLMKHYKIDKRPAKKLIAERDKALACLHVSRRKSSIQEYGDVGAPYEVTHGVHVEYVSGKGFVGLPEVWSKTLIEKFSDAFVKSNQTNKIRKRGSFVDDMKDDVLKWSPEEVLDWLKRIGLSSLEGNFSSADIDGKTLMEISKAELERKLGIEANATAERLFQQVCILKANRGLTRENSVNKDERTNVLSEACIEIY